MNTTVRTILSHVLVTLTLMPPSGRPRPDNGPRPSTGIDPVEEAEIKQIPDASTGKTPDV